MFGSRQGWDRRGRLDGVDGGGTRRGHGGTRVILAGYNNFQAGYNNFQAGYNNFQAGYMTAAATRGLSAFNEKAGRKRARSFHHGDSRQNEGRMVSTT